MQSINAMIPFAPLLFGGVLTAGVTYILLVFISGGLADVELDIDTDASADIDGTSEAVGLSLHVIAAFFVGVGTMGLVASFADWSWLLTILVSLLFGLFLGRFLQYALTFVMRGQGGAVIKDTDLVGAHVRVTVDIPIGKIGEGMIEEPERMKYAIRNLDDEPLSKGDMVRVVQVENGRLFVRK